VYLGVETKGSLKNIIECVYGRLKAGLFDCAVFAFKQPSAVTTH